jgi:hypothetical protein
VETAHVRFGERAGETDRPKGRHRAPVRLRPCRRRPSTTAAAAFSRPPAAARGRKNDPLYRARRTLHTRCDLLTDKQAARLMALFAIAEHVEVEATWGIYSG